MVIGLIDVIENLKNQSGQSDQSIFHHHVIAMTLKNSVIARHEAIACYTERLSRANTFLRAIALYLAMTIM